MVGQLELEYSRKRCTSSGAPQTVTLNEKNMSLPPVAGQIPLEPPLFADFYKHLLERPTGLLLPVEQRPRRLPTMFMDVQSWPPIAKKLRACRLVKYVPEEQVPVYTLSSGRQVQARAGIFGVPKSSGDLARLIIDRRKQNSLE
eukprot:6467911-Amphidinium_carterae.1